MGLPILENPTLREVAREQHIASLKKNFKSPKTVGISNLGKPDWLKIRPPNKKFHELRSRMRELGLVTVCQESHCPNMSECWSGGTATFMVLGDTCTRGCKFCAVKARGIPDAPDPDEPKKLVQAVAEMHLDYVVITCVDRDDLKDGGAQHLADCVSALKHAHPELLIEVLTGDFQGNHEHLKILLDAGVDVLAHNIETVRRLTPTVRDPRATYNQSLGVLKAAKAYKPNIKTKSSVMVGLGEQYDELLQTMSDLREHDVDIVTFGQYLQPSSWHLKVERYVPPSEFTQLEVDARKKGFLYCASGPFIRSSYRAGELFIKGMIEKERAKN